MNYDQKAQEVDMKNKENDSLTDTLNQKMVSPALEVLGSNPVEDVIFEHRVSMIV